MAAHLTNAQLAEIISAIDLHAPSRAACCARLDEIAPRRTGKPWTTADVRRLLSNARKRKDLAAVAQPIDALAAWQALRAACLACLTDGVASLQGRAFSIKRAEQLAAILGCVRFANGEDLPDRLTEGVLDALARLAKPAAALAPAEAIPHVAGNGRPNNRATIRPRDRRTT